MNKEQILSAIKGLACSQGFYGRFLLEIENNPKILDIMEEQNFGDTLDMVMWLEG